MHQVQPRGAHGAWAGLAECALRMAGHAECALRITVIQMAVVRGAPLLLAFLYTAASWCLWSILIVADDLFDPVLEAHLWQNWS